VLENFIIVTDSFEPTDDGKASGVFVTKSYDSTSHFTTATRDVMEIFERITGSPPDLTPKSQQAPTEGGGEEN
jgi:Rab GDP dissociation inhibitor